MYFKIWIYWISKMLHKTSLIYYLAPYCDSSLTFWMCTIFFCIFKFNAQHYQVASWRWHHSFICWFFLFIFQINGMQMIKHKNHEIFRRYECIGCMKCLSRHHILKFILYWWTGSCTSNNRRKPDEATKTWKHNRRMNINPVLFQLNMRSRAVDFSDYLSLFFFFFEFKN